MEVPGFCPLCYPDRRINKTDLRMNMKSLGDFLERHCVNKLKAWVIKIVLPCTKRMKYNFSALLFVFSFSFILLFYLWKLLAASFVRWKIMKKWYIITILDLFGVRFPINSWKKKKGTKEKTLYIRTRPSFK